MAAQMIESVQMSIQMSVRCTSKEIGLEDASHFKWHSISKYFELIVIWVVNWFLNLLVCNVIEREIKREKVQMKPPLDWFIINLDNLESSEVPYSTEQYLVMYLFRVHAIINWV